MGILKELAQGAKNDIGAYTRWKCAELSVAQSVVLRQRVTQGPPLQSLEPPLESTLPSPVIVY